MKFIEKIPYERLENDGVSVKDVLAWLEKQGEQKPIIEMIIPEESLGIDSETYNNIVNDCIFGKNKPKFKVGDYLVNDYCKGKVIALTDDAYLLDTEQGIPFSHEHNAHLWSLNDAKKGDVLAGKIDGDNYILIFKQIKDGWIETYGHYYNTVNRFCVPSQLFCRDYKGVFYPATKEQRDLLFQKMKEAGYEWDTSTSNISTERRIEL